MKKLTRSLIALLFIAALLLCGCSETQTPGSNETTDSGIPAEPQAKHEITVSEVESILAANGLRTNENSMWSSDGTSSHGGMQMRVCRTERGVYTAFARDFGAEETTGIQEFYVAKIDNDGEVSVLYFGEFRVNGNEIDVNIGRDITDNIVVTVIALDDLRVYVFDKDTDEVSEYSVEPSFAGERPHDYTMAMFDFENRKIYAFYPGYGADYVPGNYQIDWFTFDLETMQWSDTSLFASFTEIGRHCYMYPFPDGNGGAYIVSTRSERPTVIVADKLAVQNDRQYIWDRIDLFHIPDLTSSENVTYTPVQLGDESRGLDGIWSAVSANTDGDVTIDSNGYMHITYRYNLTDYLGTNTDYDDEFQYRHAIYDGMECIYNEKLDLEDDSCRSYKPMIRQSSDGQLHMIAPKLHGDDLIIEFYSAEDELGKSWKYEKSHTVKGVTADSLSLTDTREGSIQDDVISCFYYRSFYNEYKIGNGYTSANVLNISLEDYSVTEPIDILEDFDIVLDPRHDERIPANDNQTTIVSTENGVYAAFVYNYKYSEDTEYFHIAKIDGDGKATVLYSGSFSSDQDKNLTMNVSPDGKIYVCPPVGESVYVIDQATDAVTPEKRTQVVIDNKNFPQQSDIIFDSEDGKGYYIHTLPTDAFDFITIPADSSKSVVLVKTLEKYTYDAELTGGYTNMYTLADKNGGAYMVGTRQMTKSELEGKLEYVGHIDSVNDSVVLFYLPSLADSTEIKCVDVQLPYEDEGADGIWSCADIKDVYLDSNGKLNVLYAYYHFDFDDGDRRENAELEKNTLKYYLAVYEGGELVSREELVLDRLTSESSVKIAETADGTVYLITCNLQKSYKLIPFGLYPEGGEAKISVYCETENGFTLVTEKELGEFAAEGFFISSSEQSDTFDCLVYASDNDVYYTNIAFKSAD